MTMLSPQYINLRGFTDAPREWTDNYPEDSHRPEYEELPDPLVPEGRYRVKFVECVTRQTMYGPKVYLRFVVISPEEFAGTCLWRYYNAKRLTSPEGPGGGFALSLKGDGYRELTRLLNALLRADRIPMSHLKLIEFTAEVRTIARDGKGNEPHEFTRYSKIKLLHRIDTEPKPAPYPSPPLSPNLSPNPDPKPTPKPYPTFTEEDWAAIE